MKPEPMSRWFAALALAILLAGCGMSEGSTIPAPPDADPAVERTAAPESSDSREPSPGPSLAEPSSGESDAARADPESYLLSGFRTDPVTGQPIDLASCAPLLEGLPGKATHGIECTIADGPAERVGVYLFPSPEDARHVYEKRLAQYGVEPDTFRDIDSCGNEGPMHPVRAGEEHLVPRYGTYLNENGFANLRALFPVEAVYVGVLGRTADCGELDTWAHFPRELGATPNPVNVWFPPPAAP